MTPVGMPAAAVTAPLAAASNSLVEDLKLRFGDPPSPMRNYYELLLGLLFASRQSYAGAIRLVEDAAGDQIYPVQAEILARAVVEGLALVLVLREGPEARTRLYLLDELRNARDACVKREGKASDPRWQEWLKREGELIEQRRQALNVTDEEWRKLPSWPNVGTLTTPPKKGSAFITGSAAALWDLLYLEFYDVLSCSAHHKGKSRHFAMLREHRTGKDRRDLRDHGIIAATIAHACTVTEIAATVRLSSVAKELRESWMHLRPWDDIAQCAYSLRVGDLLDAL